MDSKTKAECSITPGWHRIDEEMQTNAEHRNLSAPKQNQRAVTYVILCSALGFSPWYLAYTCPKMINNSFSTKNEVMFFCLCTAALLSL